MSSAPNQDRQRRGRYRAVIGVIRVLAVTFLVTLLAFCIALFFGIVGVVLAKMIRGTPTPDMTVAYRHVAFPIAIAVLVVTFVMSLVIEIRRYKLERTRDGLSAPRTKAA